MSTFCFFASVIKAENSRKLTTIVTESAASKELKLKGGISISASLFPGKSILIPEDGDVFKIKLDLRLEPFRPPPPPPTASSKKLNHSGENPVARIGKFSRGGKIGFSIGTGGRSPRHVPLKPPSTSNPSQKCKKCTDSWVNSSKTFCAVFETA